MSSSLSEFIFSVMSWQSEGEVEIIQPVLLLWKERAHGYQSHYFSAVTLLDSVVELKESERWAFLTLSFS